MASLGRTLQQPARLACLLLSLLLLAGCSDGVKLGNTYLVPPWSAVEATSVELVRTQNDHQGTPRTQTLTLDLTTGRASLTDVDGRVYPMQVDAQDCQQLQAFVTSRRWRNRRYPAARGSDQIVQYAMSVHHQGQTTGRSVRWQVPARRPLPDQIALATRLFDQAHRVAHPLSLRLDLLR